MQVLVNGQPRDVPEGTTVAELLGVVGAPARGVAVEVNQELVRRADLPARRLQPGDRVEVVGLVGGG
ncbi:MAG: sulfur carrier protein ThiS [Planctomycetes bacterium]|nr:sulfur carrier protein ThiS [Planctomycetota bacterium]